MELMITEMSGMPLIEIIFSQDKASQWWGRFRSQCLAGELGTSCQASAKSTSATAGGPHTRAGQMNA